MAELEFGGRKARILDFDIEARPLSWYGGDFVTREITAIAARFLDAPKSEPTQVWLLGVDDPVEMLEGFVNLYDEADVVTGHYIRKHDLPIINAALLELGLPGLTSKMTSDTKLDLVKTGSLAVSQQALGGMFDLKKPKVAMPQQRWRDANRLTPNGIEGAIQRVTGDVMQHKEMRAVLLERGLLKPPSLWTP